MNTAILTVDDIASKNTPAIVDYLKEKNIKAIFFAQGDKVEQFYEEAIYAVKSGMIVGNHTYSHQGLSNFTLEEAIADIEKCEALLDKLYQDSGVERVYRPFRFPFGDKGGDNKEALQAYFKEKGFHKVDDSQIPYPWWKEVGMDKEIDTFWSFDFQEYMIRPGTGYTKESVWEKMHNQNPENGGVLLGEGNHNFVLIHAHDDTEEVLPEYYKLFIGHLLENGLTFVEPKFVM